MASHDDAASDASKAMLTAALGGLLCLGQTSCTSLSAGPTATSSTSAGASTTGGAGGAHGTSGSSATSGTTAISASSTSDAASTSVSTVTGSVTASGTAISSTATGSVNPHTPIPDTACASGIVANPQVLQSNVAPITEVDFQSLCAQAGGIFEIQPLCGGSNACRGFAYDSETQTLTQHSCQHTNTCAGYNCVVCT